MLTGDTELSDPKEAKDMVPGQNSHVFLLLTSKSAPRRPWLLPSHPPEEGVWRKLDVLGLLVLYRISCSEYPETAVHPDGGGDGEGEEGEEGHEDEEGHGVHRVASLLEQVDHQVDSLAQDEKDEENKHLKLQ